MFTHSTQAAIAVLHDISSGNALHTVNFPLTPEAWMELFGKLEAKGLIRCLPDKEKSSPLSYELCRPLYRISLLEILEALGEPINCSRPTPEIFYLQNRLVAQKVGVLNSVARMFLSEIKISEWLTL